MSMRDILDKIAEGFGAAITDVRQKVVEEGWFGRTVTPPPAQEASLSEGLGWTTHAQRAQAGLAEPHQQHMQEADRDKGMDR